MTHVLKGALLPLIAIVAGCSQGESEIASTHKPAEQLAPPQETGVLEVATRNGATRVTVNTCATAGTSASS